MTRRQAAVAAVLLVCTVGVGFVVGGSDLAVPLLLYWVLLAVTPGHRSIERQLADLERAAAQERDWRGGVQSQLDRIEKALTGQASVPQARP
jgi:hypothetical protein